MKEVITSTKNDFVKIVKSLKTKKGRDKHSSFLVEGVKCVKELLTHRPDLLESLIVAGDSCNDFASTAKKFGAKTYVVKEHVLAAVSDFKTAQGVAAVAKLPKTQAPQNGFILALDDVSDPQNVGTMIRTADAAGCSGIVLSHESADYLSPKSVRASMGSVFHLPIYITELSTFFSIVIQKGYRVAAADMHGTADYNYDWQKTCLVIGNEARGVSDKTLNICTDKISVPMYGKAESLNAAVAAGILIYKIRT